MHDLMSVRSGIRARLPGRVAGKAGAMTFDVFISYSHAADGRLAPALQRGMQRLAKPWYQPRAMRVFRDESALEANPHLWSSIESALDDAAWLVLLASPDAVSSDWVNRELDHWLATKSSDRILVVVTDGTWNWDPNVHELSGSAVPLALRRTFVAEPRHVDLSWARSETDLDLRNSRFRDVVAQLAAPVHGVAKDELEGEDIRLHRRARRLARGGVSVLAILVVVALVTSGIALVERNRAEQRRRELSQRNTELSRQQQETERERRAEVARRLVNESSAAEQNGAPDEALLLAAEAARFAAASGGLVPDGDVAPALMTALGTNPSLVTSLQGLEGTIADVAISPDGSRAAALTTKGQVGIWSLSDFRLLTTLPGPTTGLRVTFTDPDTVVVAGGAPLGEFFAVAAPAFAPTTLVAFRAAGNGAVWRRAWSRSIDTVTALAGAASGSIVLVTVGHLPVPPSPGFGTYPASEVHVLAADGTETAKVVLPTAGVATVSTAPDGTEFAVPDLGPPQGSFLTSTKVDVYAMTGRLERQLPVSIAHDERVGSFPVQLRFSTDGSSLAFIPDIDPPVIHRFDLATGVDRSAAVPQPPSNLSTTAGGPIAIAPDLNRVVQRYGDLPFPNFVGIGYVDTQSFIGALDAPLSPANQIPTSSFDPMSWSAPVFTRDGTRFLSASGTDAIPVFADPRVARSHFGTIAHLANITSVPPSGSLAPDGSVLVTVDGSASGNVMHVVPAPGHGRPLDVPVGDAASGGFRGGADVTFGATADVVAIGFGDGSAELRSTRDGKLVMRFRPSAACTEVCPVSVNLSGTLADGRFNITLAKRTRTWDLVKGDAVPWPDLVTAHDAVADMSASGAQLTLTTYVITAGIVAPTVRVYTARDRRWTEQRSLGAERAPADPGVGGVTAPDGQRFVESTGDSMTMYDLARGRKLWSTTARVGLVWFGAAGRTLYTVHATQPGGSSQLSAWSALDGTLQYNLDVDANAGILDLVDARGHLRIAVTDSHQLELADLRLGLADLVDAACREANRNLRPAEWTHYVGKFDPFHKTCADRP